MPAMQQPEACIEAAVLGFLPVTRRYAIIELDDAVMPAVDYRLPDGLSWRELHVILRAALDSPRAAGLEVTIFNPALDHDGTIARALVNALVRSLTA